MKKVKIFLASILCILSSTACKSQTIAEPYEVGTWLGFRSAAVCFTFDDNDLNQLAIVVPMFNEFDYKLTLFTITGTNTGWQDPNWTGLQEAALQGHEIASHTVTHPYLNQISLEEQITELEDSYNTINENIPGQSALTFAYPYCLHGNDSVVAQYYIAGRGPCGGALNSSTPADMLDISSTICGTQGAIRTAENFNNKVESAVGTKRLCVFLMHGIDDDGGWSPVESTELRSHLEYLQANDNKFWVETFGNIVRYIQERNAVSVTETSVQDTVITLQVSDTLDNAIYNMPVTIRRPLPEGWFAADVRQNGQLLDEKYMLVESVKYVLFDVIPDSGEVRLSINTTNSITDIGNSVPRSPTLFQNYPNPFNPNTSITFHIPLETKVKIKIYNTLGKEIVTLTNSRFSAGNHTAFWDGKDMNGNPVSSGTYFYQLIAEDFTSIKKMVLLR